VSAMQSLFMLFLVVPPFRHMRQHHMHSSRIIYRFLNIMILVPFIVGLQMLGKAAILVAVVASVRKKSTTEDLRRVLAIYSGASLWLDVLVVALYIAMTPQKEDLPEEIRHGRKHTTGEIHKSPPLEKDPHAGRQSQEMLAEQPRDSNLLNPDRGSKRMMKKSKSYHGGEGGDARIHGDEKSWSPTLEPTQVRRQNSVGSINGTTNRLSAFLTGFGSKDRELPPVQINTDDVFIPEITPPLPSANSDRRPSVLNRMTLGLMGLGVGAGALAAVEEGGSEQGEEIVSDDILFDAVGIDEQQHTENEQGELNYAELGNIALMNESESEEGEGFDDIAV